IMILSLGRSTHCRLCLEASALFKPSFCKASGGSDRTFCEKYGIVSVLVVMFEGDFRCYLAIVFCRFTAKKKPRPKAEAEKKR
ncbi:hypothetical protein, partial [Microcystis aeruginosa]|uniref:hypothetical protein n=1 Tax=Microcystis aeruginosa TaxID=1126 RepID=UPI001C12A64D